MSTPEVQTPQQQEVQTPEVRPEQQESMIPKHRFDEVYAQMKTFKEQLEIMQAEKQAQEQAELEKTAQFETLYNQTKEELNTLKALAESATTKSTEYETLLSSMVDTKLANVPEELHDLIPANLSVIEKLDWINRAEAKGLLSKQQQAPIEQPVAATHLQTDFSNMSAMELFNMAYSSK